MSTGLVYDPLFLEHRSGDLPERPERLTAVLNHLDATGLLARLHRVRATPASMEALCRVHAPEYLQRIQAAVAAGASHVDTPEVQIGPRSWDAAVLAAGGCMAMVDAVMAGTVDNGFCAVRPPGHHAERGEAMGFCLINNVAVAARHIQAQHGLARVAIVDWDVHHGNGTQHIFEDDPSVLFISLHEHPAHLYPGTGYAWEKGVGKGEGYTLNLPLPPETDDADVQIAFSNHVLPALRQFSPQFLLISAGFDAHLYDPLAHLRLTTVGYAWMTRQLKNLAATYCHNRLVSVLEGGYNLQSLAWSVAAHLEVLAEPTLEETMMDMKSGMY